MTTTIDDVITAYVLTGLISYGALFIFNIYVRRVFVLKQYVVDFVVAFLLWPIFPTFWALVLLPQVKKLLNK